MDGVKKFISHKNRGMLLEKIINKTINYYFENHIAYISKNNLVIKFKGVIKSQENSRELKNSYISRKSTVDYCGIYKGRYISFEAKSTEEESFKFSNIKEHQHKHLLTIRKLGGFAFYIIFFKKPLKFFLVSVEDIDFYNKKSLSFKEIQSIGAEIEIVFPGIIDFLSFLKI